MRYTPASAPETELFVMLDSGSVCDSDKGTVHGVQGRGFGDGTVSEACLPAMGLQTHGRLFAPVCDCAYLHVSMCKRDISLTWMCF